MKPKSLTRSLTVQTYQQRYLQLISGDEWDNILDDSASDVTEGHKDRGS